jgi:hypothetical protein
VCFIDIHLSTQELFSIQILNGRLGLVSVRHLNKTKASGLATVLIFNDRSSADLAEGRKGLAKIFL